MLKTGTVLGAATVAGPNAARGARGESALGARETQSTLLVGVGRPPGGTQRQLLAATGVDWPPRAAAGDAEAW